LRKALWGLSLAGTVLLALAALFFLLPGLKEGFSRAELPYYAGAAASMALLAGIWWFATGRRLAYAAPPLAVLAVPLLAYLALIADFALAAHEARRFANSVKIVGYTEQRIQWPGFDGPVGVRLTLELSHGVPPGGVLYAPELSMAPLGATEGGIYHRLIVGSGYAGNADGPDAPVTLLKEVLFRVPPRTAPPLDDGGRSSLTYDLLPGIVDMMAGPSHICLTTAVAGLPQCAAGGDDTAGCVRPDRYRPAEPDYERGSDLNAVWLFAGRSDVVADLSPQLTEALRRYSQWQGAGERWTAMQKRLEPQGLAAAGYGPCPPGRDSHTRYRICYCR